MYLSQQCSPVTLSNRSVVPQIQVPIYLQYLFVTCPDTPTALTLAANDEHRVCSGHTIVVARGYPFCTNSHSAGNDDATRPILSEGRCGKVARHSKTYMMANRNAKYCGARLFIERCTEQEEDISTNLQDTGERECKSDSTMTADPTLHSVRMGQEVPYVIMTLTTL